MYWHTRGTHATQVTLAELITQLRACRNVNDGYEFQQKLLARLLAVEADRMSYHASRCRI